jgi:hypothetical protein
MRRRFQPTACQRCGLVDVDVAGSPREAKRHRNPLRRSRTMRRCRCARRTAERMGNVTGPARRCAGQSRRTGGQQRHIPLVQYHCVGARPAGAIAVARRRR